MTLAHGQDFAPPAGTAAVAGDGMALALSRDTRIPGLATLTAPELAPSLARHGVGELAPATDLGLRPDGAELKVANVSAPQGERSFQLENNAKLATPPTVLDGDCSLGAIGKMKAVDPPAAFTGESHSMARGRGGPSSEPHPGVYGPPQPKAATTPGLESQKASLAADRQPAPDRSAGPKPEREASRAATPDRDRQPSLGVERSGAARGVQTEKELSPTKMAELKQSEFRSPIFQWLERASRSTALQTVVGAVAGYVLSAHMGNPSWKWALGGTAVALGGGWLLNKYLMDKKTEPGWTLADPRKA